MQTETHETPTDPTQNPPRMPPAPATMLEFIGSPEQQSGLLGALAKARAEFDDVVKDTTGQIGNSKFQYANLATLLKACVKQLSANGIGINQFITGPHGEEGLSRITTIVSGHGAQIHARFEFEGADDIKTFGSQTTYYRRYIFQAIGMLDGDKDADDHAEHIQGPNRNAGYQQQQRPAPAPQRQQQRPQTPPSLPQQQKLQPAPQAAPATITPAVPAPAPVAAAKSEPPPPPAPEEPDEPITPETSEAIRALATAMKFSRPQMAAFVLKHTNKVRDELRQPDAQKLLVALREASISEGRNVH